MVPGAVSSSAATYDASRKRRLGASSRIGSCVAARRWRWLREQPPPVSSASGPWLRACLLPTPRWSSGAARSRRSNPRHRLPIRRRRLPIRLRRSRCRCRCRQTVWTHLAPLIGDIAVRHPSALNRRPPPQPTPRGNATGGAHSQDQSERHQRHRGHERRRRSGRLLRRCCTESGRRWPNLLCRGARRGARGARGGARRGAWGGARGGGAQGGRHRAM